MLKYLKKYWLFCILAPLFMVGEVAMDLWQPDLMAKIVDQGVLQSDFQLIVNVGIRMILCVLAGGLSGVTCGVFANIASQGFGNDLRKDLFGRIMSLSFEQTDRFSTGSLITRLSNDVTQVQNMVGLAIRGFVRNGVMFAGGVFMLWRQSPRFSVVAACGLPFLAALIVFPFSGAIEARLGLPFVLPGGGRVLALAAGALLACAAAGAVISGIIAARISRIDTSLILREGN